ncbi:glycosyltransferase [Flammeovirga aprica]|uniref:Glycosyltransferase family 4 protein n=1 Tax=Flammeovirga aprica JL-4 TaxID=694437 RepID=A0A7X9RRR4_9BACT|nr:glycosyltransferase [Flammeovirga aprica]NME68163.1 glycosyltransferase family 4 protein [Flammeovirga aprica JL-4]
MKVLYLGYWGANEGLSVATIYPHLSILASFDSVQKIFYFSMERDGDIDSLKFDTLKIQHIPFFTGHGLKDKLKDFTAFPKLLIDFIKKENVDKIIARGAPAGAIAWMVWKKNKIPFVVESFEPHADYMLESGVWSKYDPRYLMEKYWEEKQKIYAQNIITVSNNYKNQLISEGVKSDILEVGPCCVDTQKFQFIHEQRECIRKDLGIPENAIVGIYVGKIGGIYYSSEAVNLFKDFINLSSLHHLIILTPQLEEFEGQFSSENNVFIRSVPHSEVPNYLSASDFAFSLHRPSPSKIGLSPIKNGEYWANGLPILISEGIGDDSNLIKENNIGVIWDSKNNHKALNEIVEIVDKVKRSEKTNTIVELAKNNRKFSIVEKVYKSIL